MPSKVVVHSTSKRFFQVVGIALLMAGILVGLKKISQWEPADSSTSTEAPSVTSSASASTSESDNSPIVGRSSVIDGDTLDIHGMRIRLEGIDAPESRQPCGGEGREWPCGQQAALALSDWIGDRPVTCHSRGTDRYRRTVARCFVGNDDMQAWLVSNGWALAYRRYSEDYVVAEEHASAAQAGMWRDDFVPPWEWRHGSQR